MFFFKIDAQKVIFVSLTENSELCRTLYEYERWLHDESKRRHGDYKRIEAASGYKFSQARGSN